jgi:hypothetical protein
MATSKVLSLFEHLSARNEPHGEAQPGLSYNAPEPTMTRHDALDDVTHTGTRQDAPGGITGQSTLPGKADAGALPAGESSPAAKSRFEPFEPDVDGSIANLLRQASSKASGKASSKASGTSPSTPAHARQPASPTRADTPGASRRAQTHAEPAADTSPSDAPQNAPEGTTVQSTQTDKAASQPDDTARLRAQIDGCLAMETDPALRLFLKSLLHSSHHYPAEMVRRQLEAYLQAGNPDDFLTRLAVLHLDWVKQDVASDPDGNWLKRGNAGDRTLMLEAIRKAFEQEARPVVRCYLARLARKALTDPVYARERLDDYARLRTDRTWQWLAEVAVAGSPEAAFQWRLQAARRKTTDADLHDYLDKLEQEARANLPEAVSKLEAFTEPVAPVQGAPAA